MISVLFVNLVSAEDYVQGEIIVGFNDGVTEIIADELIESYGLTWESNSPFTFWKLVKVPVGEEEKWIDIFSEEEIVYYAELNGIISIDSPSQPGQTPKLIDGSGLYNENDNMKLGWGNILKIPAWVFVCVGIILIGIISFFIFKKKR